MDTEQPGITAAMKSGLTFIMDTEHKHITISSPDILAFLFEKKTENDPHMAATLRRLLGLPSKWRRVSKYPIQQLDVGKEVVLPWREDEQGGRHWNQRPLLNTVTNEAKRYGKKFEFHGEWMGLRVRRVK